MKDHIEKLRRMIDSTRVFKVMGMNMTASDPGYIHGAPTLRVEIMIDERALRSFAREDPRAEMIDIDAYKTLVARSEMSELKDFVDAPKGVKIKKEPKQPSFTELLRDV